MDRFDRHEYREHQTALRERREEKLERFGEAPVSTTNKTGKFISAERLKAIKGIYDRTQEPLFGVSSYSTQRAFERTADAQRELHEAIDAAAVEIGLPPPAKDENGDVIHYGLLGSGEITTATE